MLVVGADAVDPQPHSAKDADDDGGDWPIQHLAAVDSMSLAADGRLTVDADCATMQRNSLSGKGHTQVCMARPRLTSRSTERPILSTAGDSLYDRYSPVINCAAHWKSEQNCGRANLLGPWWSCDRDAVRMVHEVSAWRHQPHVRSGLW